MVGVATVLGVVLTLFISLILPVIAIIVYGVKNKKQGIWTAWLLGIAGFFVMQVVIRIPVLSILGTNEGFLSFATNHYVIYCLLLAFTAGLFEVVGRYVVAKLMSKNLTFKRGIAAGLGHGGIEAILVVGLTYINNITYIILINSGQFDSIVERTASLGADTSSLISVKELLVGPNFGVFYLAGYERFLTMILQVGLSLMVCYFVSKKKDFLGIILCLGIHFVVDFTAPFVNGLSTDIMGNKISQSTAYLIIYLFLTVVVALVLFMIMKIRKSWKLASEEKAM